MLKRFFDKNTARFMFCALVPVAFAAWSLPAAHAADASAILSSLASERGQKTQSIEDMSGAMNHFYESLARTAAGRPGAVTRIAHFGDAMVQKEIIIAPTRRLLQNKWGEAGHGFVFGSRPEPWYRPRDAYYKSSNSWISFNMTEANVRDRRFGLGGAAATAFKSKATVECGSAKKGETGKKITRFDILFPRETGGGPIELSLDGKPFGILDTEGPDNSDAHALISVPEGEHRLELTAMKKKTRLFGLIMENDGPGVVYDALGVDECEVKALLSVDEKHWQGQLRHRNPDLVIINLGSNDISETLNFSYFQLSMKTLIDRVKKALPGASILIMSPPDKSIKENDVIKTHPMIPQMVATQRDIAAKNNTAFWSVFDAMGGKGSMAKWRETSPKLGARNLTMPTRKGGAVLGKQFYNALMQGFAEFLQKNGLPDNPPPAPPADPLDKVEITKTP